MQLQQESIADRVKRLEAKGFRHIKGQGRIFAVPDFLDPEHDQNPWMFTHHPATLSAPTLDVLETLVDGYDPQRFRAVLLDTFRGYNLMRGDEKVFATPAWAGEIDVHDEDERRRFVATYGEDVEEVKKRLEVLEASAPVEFAGWLPIFEKAGNCGRHPQFAHTTAPPPGYRFRCSAPRKKLAAPVWDAALLVKLLYPLRLAGNVLWAVIGVFLFFFGRGPSVGIRARFRAIASAAKLFVLLWRGGCRVVPIVRFIRTRHFTSQMLLGAQRGPVFLPSMPFTYGQNPWFVEIEDPTTLFYPHIQNGHTHSLRVRESPFYPILRTFLESKRCKGIITHMRSTARMVKTLFASDEIAAKVFYAPLGVKSPERWQRHEDNDEIHLIFTNSWHQQESNFFVRGGLDVLEAFAVLRARYPHLRLTMRTGLPHLDHHYLRLIEDGWVRVISRFQEPAEMDALLSGSHIFVLPAARVHIVSLLQAMSYGLAVVTCDGWGVEEYVTHERNGLIVKGRYGKVSWADYDTGFLREDYDPIYTSDPEIVQGLVDAISQLVENRELRKTLGHNARTDVQNTYNLESWNRALKKALDAAL
ncbi:MAG: glycosyltransferase family 4 protein [Planctomycetes bacterium]|nr:glycosyltransferase family 4 protein [Planctomycetota bacterium]